MKPTAIAAARLHLQGLMRPDATKASDVVRALGAVQSQDYDGAKWALSQRTRHGAPDAEIERELNEGRILRTHVLRPTWHFVAPEDLRWMLALTAPRVIVRMAPYNKHLELTADVFRRSNKAIARALEGGKHLTRAELRVRLEKSRIGAITSMRLGHLMMQAELDALVCSGPRRGKQFTYALIDERVPASPSRDRDTALADLTQRYFRARGPATAQDFAWWSGLTVGDAKRGIDMVGRELERLEIDERAYWRAAGAETTGRIPSKAHLLPNYDEFFIGFKDRGAIGQRLGDASLVSSPATFLTAHVITLDGQLVGGWRRVLEPQRVTVTLDILTRLTPAEKKRVTKAAQAYGRFLGRTVAVQMRNVRSSRKSKNAV